MEIRHLKVGQTVIVLRQLPAEGGDIGAIGKVINTAWEEFGPLVELGNGICVNVYFGDVAVAGVA